MGASRRLSRAEAMRQNGGGVDLARAALSDGEARDAQEMLELRMGMRCGGCGRRIGLGFKFASLDPRATEPVLKLSACNRLDCDFAESARDGATVMEMVEFAWLDVNGIDAPATKLVMAKRPVPPAE